MRSRCLSSRAGPISRHERENFAGAYSYGLCAKPLSASQQPSNVGHNCAADNTFSAAERHAREAAADVYFATMRGDMRMRFWRQSRRHLQCLFVSGNRASTKPTADAAVFKITDDLVARTSESAGETRGLSYINVGVLYGTFTLFRQANSYLIFIDITPGIVVKYARGAYVSSGSRVTPYPLPL